MQVTWCRRLTIPLGILAVFAIVLVEIGIMDHQAYISNTTIQHARLGHAGDGSTSFSMPANATKLAPNVYSLKKIDMDGNEVECVAVIHDTIPGVSQHQSSCGAPILPGVRWRVVESYILSTANADGLSTPYIESVTTTAFNIWNNAIPNYSFGPRDQVNTYDGVDMVSPDNKNEIGFGTFSDPGVIAVTFLWRVGNQWIEADILFNDQHFTFGDATQNNNVMDFYAILVHELGHWYGLTDITDIACNDVTMYFQAAFGETKKRTLETADIQAVQMLYCD